MNSPTVKHISDCFVRPHITTDEMKGPIHLPPWDLLMLSVHYIQKGHLYPKPSAGFHIAEFLRRINHSLSLTLSHFYPLAGRLVTSNSPHDDGSYVVSIDCANSPGARLIHAAADLTISDVLSPTYVPVVVQSFFDHDRAINHDGHTTSLVTIQVTELIDGVFVGCSFNHAVGDGASFWNFLTALSETYRGKTPISRPPVNNRWFPEGCNQIIPLPADQIPSRYESPKLLERFFHFSAESIGKIKSKANYQSGTTKISSFQSLSALVWRGITRARNFPAEKITGCRLATNNRGRMNPPLHPDYFGNSINPMRTSAAVGELLRNDLGWAAWRLHEAVVGHSDEKIKGFVSAWLESPVVYRMEQVFDTDSVMMGSSPRFDKYGIEFGLGKAVALRSGYANKFSGKVTGYPGRDGGGSVDLEICLPPATMAALESDEEFMSCVS
ncbi:unnamed protein product [Linum tenue]|uniref:Acetyltransferase n=6 Tax=Linum tenue TaxID=586396 RepID=A0AAV0KT49_9ROSI|nr:unnamed protein product [Linum tenue]